MAHGSLKTTWRHACSLLSAAAATESSDAHLLARFVVERDDAAFAELVRRHGAMVHGVCRRVLRNPYDAEDAFQATLLILSHKAASIRKGDCLASWLHGVALNSAISLKRNIRRRKEQVLPANTLQAERDDVSWYEVQRLLDEELARLPEQFRQPLILCYLEGKTRDEAAEELGWSLSTFRGRLERARDRLRWRLEKRGLALSAALLATLAAKNAEAAAFSISTASAQAAALATEVMRTMLLSKLKTLVLWCVAVLLLSVGVGATAYHHVAADAAPPPEALGPPMPPKPAPPEEDGLVKDYRAHLDTFQWSFTLKPQEAKGKFNAQYELRNIQLHVGNALFEPHAIGPTGKPISGNARITKEQAAMIVALLAKDNFFRASVADAERLTPQKGSHAEMWASYRKDSAPQPVQRWRTLDWNLHMVRQLETIHACVDGEAAKLLDQMLKSLEEERKEWEKKEFFTIKKVDDLDALWGDDNETGQLKQVTLDGVLPFVAWPKDLTDEQKKIRDDGLKFAKTLLEGKSVYYFPSRPAERGDVLRYLQGPTKFDREWTGKLPAEQTAWGGFDINILLIQEGYSPWVQRAADIWDQKTKSAYSEAQQYALINRKGIWKDHDFAARTLVGIAQNRTEVERQWGFGPIREWRQIASNAKQVSDLLDRGGISALFFSPNGKTVLGAAERPFAHQLIETATLKAQHSISQEKRQTWPVGFTNDNQPWMLSLDFDKLLLPGPKTYHLVNMATDEKAWSSEMPDLLNAAALSADGKYLAIVSCDKPFLVMLWDGRTGKKIGDLGEHKTATMRLAFSPDGKTLATGSVSTANADNTLKERGEIKLWDVAKRKDKASCQVPATCAMLQFTKDGKRLFSSMNRQLKDNPPRSEGRVLWFDATNLKEQGRQEGTPRPEKPWVESFAATPDGKMIAVLWWETQQSGTERFPVRRLRVYDVDSDKEIASPGVNIVTHVLAFSPDGNDLLAGGDQFGLTLWEALRR